MELIKRKILLENYISRDPNLTYGTLTADSFYIKVLLNQSIENMGIFTDEPFIPKSDLLNDQPDYTILIDKLNTSGYTFPFMSGGTPNSGVTIDDTHILRLTGYSVSDFYNHDGKITGFTDSKINEVTSYSNTNRLIAGFDINKETYINFTGGTINGVSRVTQSINPITYTLDGNSADGNIGNVNQNSGILYKDYSGLTRNINRIDIPQTDFIFNGEGWNETNTSFDSLVKEEYLMNIISPPIIESDILIDRGIVSVMDFHLRLSEIKNLDELDRYGNGFYNLIK